MHIVLLNGPAGSGKTFFADALRTKLFEKFNKHKLIPKSGVCSVLHCGFKEPLREMLFQFAETAGFIDFGVRTEEKYSRLKQMDMFGFTGREWQITWGTAMRLKDQDILGKILFNKLYHVMPQVALVDDLGFPDELSFAASETKRNHQYDTVVSIYLDGFRASKTYKDGQRFDDDSRICLRDRVTLLNPSIETAAGYIVGDMVNKAAPSLL